MEGWIKLHRKMLDWEWYSDINVRLVFVHLLLKANHEDNSWMGIEVKRGQLVVGRIGLAKEVGISEQNVRTAINKLKSTNELTSKSTNKYTVITITNYCQYQDINQQTNKRLTSNQPATNHKQEGKELKNEKKNTYTSDNLSLDQVAEGTLKAFNIHTGRGFKGISSFKSNLEYWLETYTPKEIEQAIKGIRYDDFWCDKMTPTMLFRKKNPQGEPVDYIGQLLVKLNNAPNKQ